MDRRVFMIGVDRIVYDKDSEEWLLNGAVEGRMSSLLARDLCHGLHMAGYELEGPQPEHEANWPLAPVGSPHKSHEP